MTDRADWTERHKAAAQLPAALDAVGLKADPEPVRDKDGKFWSSRWRKGDDGAYGEVRVYGPDYFAVLWHDAIAEGLDESGSRVFAQADGAVSFLAMAFVLGRPAQAMLVPVRERKERKPREGGKPAGGGSILDGLDIGPGFFGGGNG